MVIFFKDHHVDLNMIICEHGQISESLCSPTGSTENIL